MGCWETAEAAAMLAGFRKTAEVSAKLGASAVSRQLTARDVLDFLTENPLKEV